MKKLGFISIGLILFSCQIFAQDIKKENAPDEQIIVNRKFDENGNLIQYDSTYVHQWSSDSTLQFSFPNGNFLAGSEFPDISDFLKNFMNDSAMEELSFPNHSDQMQLDDEEFFNQFHDQFPDSLLLGNIPDMDSLMQKYNGMGIPPGFSFPEFKEFQKQLNDRLKNYPFYNSQTPHFKNEEQKKEWKELMQKHQNEIEELKKKWEGDN